MSPLEVSEPLPRRERSPQSQGTQSRSPEAFHPYSTHYSPCRASGGSSAPPLCPGPGGHAPPRLFSVLGTPLLIPVLLLIPCLGTTTEGSLPWSGEDSVTLFSLSHKAGRSRPLAPWKSRWRSRVSGRRRAWATWVSQNRSEPSPPLPPLGPGLERARRSPGAPRPRPAPPQDGQFP